MQTDTEQARRQLSYDLEEIVDRLGLAGTLETLVEICYEKSEHLTTNWQDQTGARAWRRAGDRIYDTRMFSAIADLS